jgi:thiamine biosynthesis protein ThiS
LRIQVNGEPRDVEDELTLSQLISVLQLKAEQIAVELNRTVIRRAEWSATVLREADNLEIVHFVGGGGGRRQTAGGRRQEAGTRVSAELKNVC